MKVESHSHSIEERFEFRSKAKKTLSIIILVGLVLLGIGCFQAANDSHHEDGGHGSTAGHAKSDEKIHEEDNDLLKPVPGNSSAHTLLLNKERAAWAKTEEPHGDHKGFGAEQITPKNVDPTHGKESDGGHGYSWTKRLFVNLWYNNVFFGGIALIGLFFYALQFAASAGWSAGIKRIPLAFAHWLPFAGGLMLLIFFLGSHDIFHWTDHRLYEKGGEHYDEIIAGKQGYLNTPFYIIRMVIYFVVWIAFFLLLTREAKAEDLHGGSRHYVRSKWIAAFFIIFLAVTNSTSSWDWIMSIDTHWFSTMFGWFYFAALFVSGLSAITLFVVYLKENGYLAFVSENHLHDLGKFVFAFSIFYTYVWFGQFFLIWYANIPEETIYFMERLNNMKYAPVFFSIIFLNFVLPFLLLMTRDAKRQTAFLKIVCPIVIVGQWLNFWLMVTPATLQNNGGIGFMEIGIGLVFGGLFVLVALIGLTKLPLVAKHHPMLEESIHHHI